MKGRIFFGVFSALAVFCSLLAAQDWQKGEPILSAEKAPPDAPLRRHASSLWYELSNIRRDNSGPGKGFTFDFKRDATKSLAGAFNTVLVSRGQSGRHEYRGGARFYQDHGTISATSFGLANQPVDDNLEIWLEQSELVGGKTVRIKVSRSITLGTVGQLTYAREWNAEEKRGFEELERSLTPPTAAPPAGYRVASPNMKLLAGMPVLAGWNGEWQPAEIIDVRADGSALLKYRAQGAALILRTRDWVAADDATLTRADDNPGQFKPSVKVLSGGSAAIPDNFSIVDVSTPIVKGTPLKAEWAGRWRPVTVLDVMKDGSLRIHWDDFGGLREQNRSRDTLLIAADTRAALTQPDAAEKFAVRAERAETGGFDTGAGAFDRGAGAFGRDRQAFGRRMRSRLHDYPIDIPIPKSALRVTGETPLEEGTKLGACWGRKWWDVTVLAVNDDDTVRIHWDKFHDAWDGDVTRENLIISKKEFRKVQAKPNRSARKTIARSEEKSNGEPSTTENRFRVVLKSFGSGKIAVTKVVVDVA